MSQILNGKPVSNQIRRGPATVTAFVLKPDTSLFNDAVNLRSIGRC
ncbi:hypothetical protein HNO89_000141 [Sporosarcina luteola]|nr:hypothetical protein [Sporosarcina luteola]